jgi:hypothetical protein
MADDFSADARHFIDQHVESLALLEALLLLRSDPQREWDAAEMAKALYIPPDQAGTLLADLIRRGFAKAINLERDLYSYNVADPAIDRLIAEVASAYSNRRVAVISLIYSKPLNKVQTFADAFRLRKEGPT